VRSAREGLQLGMDLGVDQSPPALTQPVKLSMNQPLGHAAEMTEGISKATDKCFRGLPPPASLYALRL